MATVYIGIGECKASKTPHETLKTMALGSCVAVIMFDPANRSVGLLHAALPDSSINRRKQPGMFVDSGIPLLLKKMMDLGYDGKSKLIVKLTGGASIINPNQTFNIGNRNILAVKKALMAHKLEVEGEDVGGKFSRTVVVGTNNGKVTISSPGREQWNL